MSICIYVYWNYHGYKLVAVENCSEDAVPQTRAINLGTMCYKLMADILLACWESIKKLTFVLLNELI